jgi:hypothetical protein
MAPAHAARITSRSVRLAIGPSVVLRALVALVCVENGA